MPAGGAYGVSLGGRGEVLLETLLELGLLSRGILLGRHGDLRSACETRLKRQGTAPSERAGADHECYARAGNRPGRGGRERKAIGGIAEAGGRTGTGAGAWGGWGARLKNEGRRLAG